MIVKELFGTQIINASFLFANSNISVKYYSKDFPSVRIENFLKILMKKKNPLLFILKNKYPENKDNFFE